MIFKLFLLFSISFYSINVCAQSPAILDIDRSILIVNKKEYAPGFWSGYTHHKEAFRASERAYAEMEDAEFFNKVTWSLIGASLIPLSLQLNELNKDNPNKAMGRTYFYSTLILAFSGLYFNFKSGFSVVRAIQYFNEDLDKTSKVTEWKTESSFSLALELNRDMIGLGCNFEF